MTTYLFRPPVRSQGPRVTRDSSEVQKALFRHFVTGGTPVTVLITGGVVTESVAPLFRDINAADTVCQGGGENIISATDAYLLVAAGYEVLADGVPMPPSFVPGLMQFPSIHEYPAA